VSGGGSMTTLHSGQMNEREDWQLPPDSGARIILPGCSLSVSPENPASEINLNSRFLAFILTRI